MSTDRHAASHDPRWDGIYQRGGAASGQRPDLGPRRAPADEPSRTTPASTHGQRRTDAPAVDDGPPIAGAGTPPEPAIREVGTQPDAPDRRRNPFDVWVWAVAAALTTLGVVLISAPIVSAQAYAEQMMSQSGSGMYLNPWYNYTINVAPTLILLGVGTAVVQLFILSLRHTLRAPSSR